MAYKDKDKQKQADRERQRRYRTRRDTIGGHSPKGVTDGSTSVGNGYYEGSDGSKAKAPILPANFGQPDCECMHCKSKRVNHEPISNIELLSIKHELNRVSLPGDVDYEGV